MGHYILVEKDAKLMKKCWKCKYLFYSNQIAYLYLINLYTSMNLPPIWRREIIRHLLNRSKTHSN